MLVPRIKSLSAARLLCAATFVAIASSPIRSQAQSPELWAAQTSPTTVILTWTSVPASNFQVHARVLTATTAADVGPLPLRGVVAGTKTSFVLGIPLNATQVRASLKVVDAAGRISSEIPFNDLAITQSQARPSAPATVSVREIAPGKLTLEWAPVPGATAYFLGRSIAPNGFVTLCQICSTATQYTDSAVTPGAKHVYTVGAYSAAGMGGRTNSLAVTPSGLATISSGPGSGSTGIGSASGGGATGILSTSGTGGTVGGLGIGSTTGGAGTGGTFGGGGGTSVISNSLATPQNFTAYRTGNREVTLTWSPVTGATGYALSRVRIATGLSDGLNKTAIAAVTRWIDTVPSESSFPLYEYRLSAKASGKTSVATTTTIQSAPKSTFPDAVTGLKAVISSSGTITLIWSAAPRATSYQIIKDDGTRTTIRVAGNVLQYYDGGSVKLTRRYWIQAVNAEGMSPAVAFPAPVPDPKG